MAQPQTNNFAIGCIIGALVGDAAGAPLEFIKNIKNRDIDAAMKMRGGGILNVGQGQITDDGELTIAIASVLNAPKLNYFPVNNIAKAYSDWYNSDPFDCGETCGRAFKISVDAKGSAAEILMTNAAKYNMLSEANGALMRATPIAARFFYEPTHVIAQYAKIDAMLSHPNQVCLDCNAAYCIALAELVKSNGNTKQAWHEVSNYIDTHVFTDVKDWFINQRHLYKNKGCTLAKANIGHVKHAFCMAMNILDDPIDFETGIRRVLEMGGDTDTNAAICGGMLGAIHGLPGIPKTMRDPVLHFYYDRESLMGYDRPAIYSAKHFQCLNTGHIGRCISGANTPQ